jgi:multidrug efflux pump
VLVGGLLLGTFLTLYVVPVAYTLIASRQVRGVIEDDAHQHGQSDEDGPSDKPSQPDKPRETGEPNALGHS